MEITDLTNKQFGYWLIKGPYQTKKSPKGRFRTYWFCQCVAPNGDGICGKHRWVLADNLKKGSSTNCGCMKPRHTPAQELHYQKLSASGLTHGMTGKRLYRVWQSMKARCENPNNYAYRNYGARGIRVCDEWQTYEPFQNWALANGYSEHLTIERNDPNGNYEPNNCRFITLSEQTRNKRNTIWIKDQNHLISLSTYCYNHAVPYLQVWSALKIKDNHPDVWERLQSPLT
jgi:hypothetical protein